MENDEITFTKEQFNPPGDFVNVVKYSPNGRYYATIKDTTTLEIFDGYNNETKISLTSSEQNQLFKDVAFTSDGNIAAMAIADRIMIYEVPTCKEINVLRIPDFRYPGMNASFIRLCFGSNDLHIAAATEGIMIYVITQFRRELPLTYRFFNIDSLEFKSLQYFKCNNSILSTGSGWRDECVMWNAESGPHFPEKMHIEHRFTEITHSVISPDGRYILLTHLNNLLSSWKVESENIYKSNPATYNITLYQMYSSHKSTNKNLMGNLWYTGRKRLVLAGSLNGLVFIWNFEDGKLLTKLNTNSINEAIQDNIEPELDPDNIVIHIEPQPDSYKLLLLKQNGELTMWRKKI